MSSHPLPPASQILWRELYKTALFEPDPGKLLEDVMRAESAIVVRARLPYRRCGVVCNHARTFLTRLDCLRLRDSPSPPDKLMLAWISDTTPSS